MRVIVAGSRNFDDYEFVSNILDQELKELDIIVCGGAKGVDECGRQYALKHDNVGLKMFRPKWDKYGKAAGPIRNEEMAKNADRLIAFCDGSSKGTSSMIKIAQKYNLEIKIININGKS